MYPSDPKLQNNRVDNAVAIARGVLGAVPFAGGALAEIIGYTIPNQRVDRIIAFLNELDKRLEKVEIERLHQNKYALDLFEDGIYQSVKVLSDNRNQYLANFLRQSIDVDSVSYSTRKQLLSILKELTDDDLEVLISVYKNRYQSTARERSVRSLTYGQYDALSDEEREEYEHAKVSFGLHMATLSRLNLIYIKHREVDPQWENSNIDSHTGLPEIESCELTNIGKLILVNIGVRKC